MRKRFPCLTLLLLFAACAAARAQSGGGADVEAIRGIETRWESAWNHHDIAAMVQLGARDADWVNLAGQWFAGREAFAKSLQSLHAGKVKNSTWHTDQMRVRFLSPTIALVHVYFSIRGERDPDGSLRPPRRGICTRVEKKSRGRWLIMASQATSMVPPATAVAVHHSNSLAGQ